MAIWKIPNEYKIDYSPNGDDINTFSRKVKYCLEEAFNSLNELHTAGDTLTAAVESLGAGFNLPIQIENPADGQILVYHAATNSTPVGEAKSLIISDGNNVLCDYNGSNTANINVKEILAQSGVSREVKHLSRLVENLYLALSVMELDPGGYDGLDCTTFYGTYKNIDWSRSSVGLEDNKLSSNNGILITQPILLANAATGEPHLKSNAHLVIKHKNVADAQITAEIALREAIYVRDEVIAIGTGNSQAATLANTNNLTDYYFALKFNGVIQTGNFTFNPTSGQVTFIVVTASYFYNWGAEKKRAHIPTSTTKDARRRSSRIRVRRAMLRR